MHLLIWRHQIYYGHQLQVPHPHQLKHTSNQMLPIPINFNFTMYWLWLLHANALSLILICPTPAVIHLYLFPPLSSSSLILQLLWLRFTLYHYLSLSLWNKDIIPITPKDSQPRELVHKKRAYEYTDSFKRIFLVLIVVSGRIRLSVTWLAPLFVVGLILLSKPTMLAVCW